jgi:hypothetical protein
LRIAENESRVLQVILDTDNPACPSVRFFSRSKQETSDWIMHARATVLPETGDVATALRVPSPERMFQEEYDRILRNGVEYGQTDPRDWLYRLEWQRRNRVAEPASECPPARWLIIQDSRGLAQKLADRLRLSRQACQLVSPKNERVELAAGIVYLPGLDAATLEQAQAACEDLLLLVRVLVREKTLPPPKLWLVTRSSQSVTGKESVLNPPQAPLWGVFRALALEHPEWLGGIIDLDGEAPAESQVSMLAAELLQLDGANFDDQVVFRGGQRYAPRLVRDSPRVGSEKPVSFDPRAAYLITGGLGALGLRLANWLAMRGARYIVLAGRQRPNPKQLEAIRTIETRGVTIITSAADCGRREQMEAVIGEFGLVHPPLFGVFHLASVWSGSRLEEMDDRTFETMFRAKAAGAWYLHELTQRLNLDWFVLFSSVASILGSHHLGHYAAANQFLNSLAQFRRARRLPALAVNWGPLKDTPFSSPDGRRSFEEFGLVPMDSDAAFEVLGDLLASGATEQMVAQIDWSVLQPVYESKRRLPLLDAIRETSTVKTGAGSLETLKRTPKGQIRDVLIELVRQHFTHVLKFRSSRPVDTSRGFFEMGMDSITSVEFRKRLEADLECALPSTLTFAYPNVDSLATYLALEVLQSHQPSPPAPATSSAAADDRILNAEMQGLTEEEVHASLIEELNRAGY